MWRWACLLPHPPILVPQVGQGRENEAPSTLAGLRELRRRLPLPAPPGALILSPHFRYVPGSLLLGAAPRFRGNLGAFGAPSVARDLPGDPEEARRLAERLGPRVPCRLDRETSVLDHASLVPLALLGDPGAFSRVVVANPVGLDRRTAYELGEGLRDAAPEAPWAFLASGDLSHRLFPGAPAGFSPLGAKLDGMVAEALRTGDPRPLLDLPESEVEAAGECGLRSVLALLGLVQAPLDLLSYEGPFGVGYATACWVAPDPSHPYPRLARRVLEESLQGRAGDLPGLLAELGTPREMWTRSAACFVSLHGPGGTLRGCIGTLHPLTPSLDREISRNALAAATEDPRFPPVRYEELRGLHLSVDVLSEPEPAGPEDLDPRIYGVIVSARGRRGVLLPDLEGVDTVEQQIAIAARKAGLDPREPLELQRFRVERYAEPER